MGHYGIYQEKDGIVHEQIHWELASVSLISDRWCPMSYFDGESRKIVERIWESVPATDQMKKQFPYICSGDYYGKEEKF